MTIGVTVRRVSSHIEQTNKFIAIFKGVCCTALLTAVLMQKLQLSDAEKNVLNFVHRNRSSLKRRRAAATLIQTVWRAHKAQQLSKLVSSERTQQMKLRNKKLQDEAVAK